MGNMFRCTLKSGGASGTGIPLIVNCSEDFAGKTITATDGTTTLSETCPSASPYTVQFDLPNTGSWTISGVIEGQTYFETISVTEYQLSLETGFNYKMWVSLGGLDPDDYASLSAVFADEKAVRRLMLVHASADYLIDCVTDDITEIDDFCANDTAMKWLGLCDYVCDGLTAITGVKAKLLASTYWERYLKDHVPVMTNNTAPYGEVSASSSYTAFSPYNAFDESVNGWYTAQGSSTGWLQYKFATPTNVKKIQIGNAVYYVATVIQVQGSNDGSTFETIDTINVTDTTASAIHQYSIDNDAYYLYYRLNITESVYVSGGGNVTVGLSLVQFYGRALNVSVPVMTSNTAPYGEVIYFKNILNYQPWMAFNSAESQAANEVVSGDGVNPAYIGYDFKRKVLIRKAKIDKINYAANETDSISLVGSNDKSTWTVLSTDSVLQSAAYSCDVNTETEFRYYAFRNNTTGKNIGGTGFQFYGVDYSEKEFEAGTTKKWLYDHGVELVDLSITGNAQKEDSQLYVKGVNALADIYTTNMIDLVPYNLLRAKGGNRFSGTYSNICGDLKITRSNPSQINMVNIASFTFATPLSSPNNISIDVSAITQEAYIVEAADTTSYTYENSLTELWLE